MPRRRPQRRQGSAVATIVAMLVGSVVVHLLLWPIGNRVVKMQWGSAELPPSSGLMEISLLPMDAPAPPKEDPEQAAKERNPDGKLVELERSTDERPPEETKYLSELDNRTQKETRAPKNRPNPGAPGGRRGDAPDATQREPSPAEQAQEKALPLGREAVSDDDGQASETSQARPADEGTLPRRSSSVASLSPRGVKGIPDALQERWGNPGTYDDLSDELAEGSETILNTRRWKYASFFNRVRNQIAEAWRPAQVHRAADPDGRIYGTKTRRTRLIVSLLPDGTLHRVRLDESSNAPHLDEEAIRAVRQAAPFRNPPDDLVDPRTGRIEFGFAFILEMNGGIRIHRYHY